MLAQTVLQKSYLLDPSVKSDNPLPVFKSVGEIVSENLTIIIIVLSCFLLSVIAWYFLKRKKDQSQVEEPSPPIDPYEDAIEAINELQSQRPRLLPKLEVRNIFSSLSFFLSNYRNK